MGSTSRKADKESNLATELAEAAAKGARKAVADAVDKAQQERGKEIAPAAPAEPVIAGVLPLSRAQLAAAAGAEGGIDEMAKDLDPAKRVIYNLKNLKVAASSAASAGVKAAVLMIADQTDVEQPSMGVHREIAAAAAATGAWVACFLSVKTGLTLTPAPNASKYTALLGPMLGGSFPTSAAMYSLVHSSTDFVKLCAFGGMTFGVFVVASGLLAGLLGTTTESVCIARTATITAIVLVFVSFIIVLCTMFQASQYKSACGVVGALLILVLVGLCVRYRW